jgi:hypothetical protein
VRCGILISKLLHTLYYIPNVHHHLLQVKVVVTELAAGPARTRWQSKVELMKCVPLHIREVLIFLKFLDVILLTLYGHFLELSLKLFFIIVTSCRLWAKSQRTNIWNTTVRIAIIATTWLFMCHNKCWGRDVASGIVWIIVISMAWPFTHHSKCWRRTVHSGVTWIVVIAMAWPFMHHTKCWGEDHFQRCRMECSHTHGFAFHAPY